MTGEITLSGRVLPVGGIKEKVLAAHRSGLTTVILPRQNERQLLEDVPAEVRSQLEVHLVRDVAEVLHIALPDASRWSPLRRGTGAGAGRERLDPDRQIAVRLTPRRRLRRLAPGSAPMARLVPLCVSLLSLAVVASPAGAGSTYQYEDDQGVVHYTNVPGDPRYSFVRKDPDRPAPGRPDQAGRRRRDPVARAPRVRPHHPRRRRALRRRHAARRGDRAGGVGRQPDGRVPEGRARPDAAHAGARRPAGRAGLLRSASERGRRRPAHPRSLAELRGRRHPGRRGLQRR